MEHLVHQQGHDACAGPVALDQARHGARDGRHLLLAAKRRCAFLIEPFLQPVQGVAGLVDDVDRVRLFRWCQASQIRCERRLFNFRYRSPAHWIQVFRDLYGPLHRAFGALDGEGAESLERAITALLAESNTAGRESLVVPGEYLEIVITKQ